MTEDKNIDNPSEENTEASAKKNIQEGDTQKESAQKAETQNTDASNASAADQSSKQEDPRDEEQSEASALDKNTPDEMQTVEDFDLNLLLDIPLDITVELGRSKIQIQELLNLGPGSTVILSKLEGEPVDVLANDKLIARGEVVLQNKKYGIRITEITSRMNRIKSLS
ncbi:MAG: flagellar motor switch protein FliN [Desulfobacterales bacterium]|nr:flagellar motor switch protein FliN [Desulfobacterales bacterium]